MSITYYTVLSMVILLLIMITVRTKKKKTGYDYMLLLTATVTGVFAAQQFQITQWYYLLPVMGITVSLALLLLALLLSPVGKKQES